MLHQACNGFMIVMLFIYDAVQLYDFMHFESFILSSTDYNDTIWLH